MARMMLGVIPNRDLAERAIYKLEDYGYDPKDISIIMRETDEVKELSKKTNVNIAEGAATGAATGGVIGGLAGLLIGLGAFTIPGIGAILIGGPIASILGLTGAAATTVSGALTGAVAGGLVGALVGIGVPERDAKVYEDSVKAGAILIAVPALGREEVEVRDILENYGATQINSFERGRLREEGMRRDPRYYEDERYFAGAKSDLAGAKGGEVSEDIDDEEPVLWTRRKKRRG